MSDADERAAVAERAARAGAAVAVEGFRDGLPIERKGGKTDVVTRADREAQRRIVEVIREAYPDDPIVGEEDLSGGAADAGDPDEDDPGATNAGDTDSGDADTGDVDSDRVDRVATDDPVAVPGSGPAWVVDPIDGTNNYVRDVPLWATSVAATVDGEPVAAANVLPPTGDVFVADAAGARRDGEPIAVSDAADPDAFVVVPTFWWDYDDREAYARATRAVVTRFGDMRRWGSAQASLSLMAAGGAEGVVTNLRPNPWDSVAGVHLVRRAGGTVTDLDGERWRHDSRGLVASNGRRHDLVLEAARDIDPD